MSFTPAKLISSTQEGPHESLEDTVSKHLAHSYEKQIAQHNRTSFEEAYDFWLTNNKPKVILDSACGTAMSSRFLANQYPDHLVIGIDQSDKRLSKTDNDKLAENCILLRSECTDFWRLAEQKSWDFDQHFLLYPNPWPKAKHLQRRWHGHPAFSSLIAISKNIELRTNWNIYAQEFTQALQIAGLKNVSLDLYKTETPITAFEKKYMQSEHSLWQVKAKL